MTSRLIMFSILVCNAISGAAQNNCSMKNTLDEWTCDRFDSWSELNEIITIIYEPVMNSSFINIHPSKAIILTDELDLTGVLDVNYTNYLTLNMINLDGIEVLTWPSVFSKLAITFEQSLIEFYLNDTPASAFECSNKTYLNNGLYSFFSIFYTITFRSQNQYPTQPICPYMFSDARMFKLNIFCQVDSILISNLWQFQPFQLNDANKSINSNIQIFAVNGYGFTLDTGLAHPLVFEQIQQLYIYRSVGSIQTDLFKHFNQLFYINIELENLRNFFHRIGIAWTQSVSLANGMLISFAKYDEAEANWIDGSDYTYPDADFCLFAQHPLPSNLTYMLDSNLTNCTSTAQWLMSNYASQDMSNTFSFYPSTEQNYFLCLNSSKGAFDFRSMILICNKSHNKSETKISAEYYQVKVYFEFIQDLLIFIAIPCACILGLGLNILVIRAVYLNKEKALKDDFYSYMSLNASFNCLYCVIFIFYPINSCVDTLSNFFCSAVFTSTSAQLYKIVFIAFLGETFKMCANISYILINVNRYMLIGREHNPTLDKISKWDFKWVIFVSFGVSALINIGHIFQYYLNDGTSYLFSANYMYVYTSYPTIIRSSIVYIYLLVYFLINYILFLVINTTVEVVLLRKLHTELKGKKARKTRLDNAPRASFSSNEPVSFRKRRKRELEERAEQRALIMVLLNAFINFFFRLPELLLLFSASSNVFPKNVLSEFFDSFMSLQLFTTDFAYFSYILTFSTNFIVYFIFNLKFKQTFSEWRHVKKRN
jgi:hypothetical protein